MIFAPKKRIGLSFKANSDGGEFAADYLLDIEFSMDFSSFLCSLSDSSVAFVDCDSLSVISLFKAHNDRINSIEKSRLSPFQFLTASSDKFVHRWDLRSKSPPVLTIKRDLEIFGVSGGVDDVLIAVSGGSSIHFYDTRYIGESIGDYSDCHSDTISQLKFNPIKPYILLSGGEDGLVCSYDTSIGVGENAIISICNTDAPIQRMCFFGDRSEGILCLSGNETMTAWHFPSAQRLGTYMDVRESHGLDYVVDGWYDLSTDQLFVLGGTHNGDGKVLLLDPSTSTVTCQLQQGHSSTIRCAKTRGGRELSGGPSPTLLVSGAEDGRLCSWDLSNQIDPHSQGTANIQHVQASTRSSNVSAKKSNADLRHRPY